MTKTRHTRVTPDPRKRWHETAFVSAPATRPHSPLRILATGSIWVCCAVGWLAAEQLAHAQREQQELRAVVRLEQLKDKIVYYDEVLTMSARMAAQTGDPAWESRYRGVEPELTRAIREAIELAPAAQSIVASTEQANQVLLDFEEEAFLHVRAGRREQAAALLASPAYESSKRTYGAGMEALGRQVEGRIAALLGTAARRSQVTLSAHAATVLAVLLTLLATRWATGRWTRALDGANRNLAAQTVQLEALNRDLDARVEARTRELAASEERFRRTFDESPVGVALLDRELRIEQVNASLGRLLGSEQGRLEGRALPELIHAEQLDHTIWLLGELTHSRRDRVEFETRFSRGDGHVWTRIIATAVGGAAGEDRDLQLLVEDLSETRAAQAQRDALEVQLRQKQKIEAIGQLAAGVAHEINTPAQYVGDNLHFATEAMGDLLDVIALQHALVECETPGPEREALREKLRARTESVDLEYLAQELPTALTQCTEGIHHVSRIVRALKAFAHPGSSDQTEVDLNQALENTLMVCRGEWKYHAEIETDLAPDLPQVICLPGEINQVFLNLIVNAAHAIADAKKSEPGRIGRIRIATQSDDASVEVRISDTGTGIPPEAQSRLFEPFFTTKEVGRGTGQGLAIAYDVVVRKHGGRISFETEQGQGTTFIVRLPITGKS